jgi:hypothetical protein
LEALQEDFGDRKISHLQWPPNYSDLTHRDFYLWGSLKDKEYITNPHTLKEPGKNISQDI